MKTLYLFQILHLVIVPPHHYQQQDTHTVCFKMTPYTKTLQVVSFQNTLYMHVGTHG